MQLDEEDPMLRAKQFVTMLPVSDLERAKQFYGHTLGLSEVGTAPDGGPLYTAGSGGDTIELMPRPDAVGEDRTLLSFEVQDLQDTIQDLEGRGVEFQDYDQPELKTEGHIATFDSSQAAWFKDSEGNVLCIHEMQA
jgi:predicted enzyme related to lactoylglutathione lyase